MRILRSILPPQKNWTSSRKKLNLPPLENLEHPDKKLNSITGNNFNPLKKP